MADIALEAKLTPEDAGHTAASKLFYYLWKSAWEQGAGTASGDAEALHDMRVNLRRLRTVMQSLEGTKKSPVLAPHLRQEIKDWRRRIGVLGDKLGAVRDFDVLSGYVENYVSKKLKQPLEAVPELAALETYLQKERARAFGPMVKKVTRATPVGALQEEFGRWALGLPAAMGNSSGVTDIAQTLLQVRMAEIAGNAHALEPAREPEELHELRKSLRRLRYTLESFSVCYPVPVKPYVKTLVELQDLLGEMQDWAVLSETTSRAFNAEVPPQVQEFNEHGSRRSSYLLGKVRRRWAELESRGFWDDLGALL